MKFAFSSCEILMKFCFHHDPLTEFIFFCDQHMKLNLFTQTFLKMHYIFVWPVNNIHYSFLRVFDNICNIFLSIIYQNSYFFSHNLLTKFTNSFLTLYKTLKDFIQWPTENNPYLFLRSFIPDIFLQLLEETLIFLVIDWQADLRKFPKRIKFLNFQENLKYTRRTILSLWKNLQRKIMQSIMQDFHFLQANRPILYNISKHASQRNLLPSPSRISWNGALVSMEGNF